MDPSEYRGLLSERLEWGQLATFVPNKRLPVYNWLYFKEGFSRDLVWKLLDRLHSRGKVLDPFCGSGTTLLACRERGVESTGIDVLPIALLTSRVKAGDFRGGELREAASELFGKRFEPTKADCPCMRFFNRHVLEDVVFFRERVRELEESVRDFFLLALVSAAMRASWAWKDGNVLKVRKHPIPLFRKFFNRRVKRMVKEWESLERRAGSNVSDSLEGAEAGCVITSPPYLGQIDYSRVYRIENWIIGEGGRVPSYTEPESEGDYFRDMGMLLERLHGILPEGGKVGMVVGNAYFPREDRIVESDLILAGLGEKAGFQAREVLVLNRRFALQKRTVKRGELRESLVVLEKE